jgi:hypothetical protein
MPADNFKISEGWPQEAGVEPQGNAGALSNPSVSESGQDDSERESGQAGFGHLESMGIRQYP